LRRTSKSSLCAACLLEGAGFGVPVAPVENNRVDSRGETCTGDASSAEFKDCLRELNTPNPPQAVACKPPRFRSVTECLEVCGN
jgi:hypothetical protein